MSYKVRFVLKSSRKQIISHPHVGRGQFRALCQGRPGNLDSDPDAKAEKSRVCSTCKPACYNNEVRPNIRAHSLVCAINKKDPKVTIAGTTGQHVVGTIGQALAAAREEWPEIRDLSLEQQLKFTSGKLRVVGVVTELVDPNGPSAAVRSGILTTRNRVVTSTGEIYTGQIQTGTRMYLAVNTSVESSDEPFALSTSPPLMTDQIMRPMVESIFSGCCSSRGLSAQVSAQFFKDALRAAIQACSFMDNLTVADVVYQVAYFAKFSVRSVIAKTQQEKNGVYIPTVSNQLISGTTREFIARLEGGSGPRTGMMNKRTKLG